MLVEGGEQNSSKDKSRYQYKGPPTRSKHWFALDMKGLENIDITREPEFISNFSNKIILGNQIQVFQILLFLLVVIIRNNLLSINPVKLS